MSLGDLIDRRRALKDDYSRASAIADNLKKQMDALDGQILSDMVEQGLSVAAGTTARVAVVEEDFPAVDDWDQFYAFIKANDAFYLLQRRVTATAYREAVVAGLVIPGVHTVPTKKLSITTR